MYIFLILWLVFLFAYLIFNVYGLIHVMAKRFRGDAVGLVMLIYIVAMLVIIFGSISIISNLDWGRPLGELFKIR